MTDANHGRKKLEMLAAEIFLSSATTDTAMAGVGVVGIQGELEYLLSTRSKMIDKFVEENGKEALNQRIFGRDMTILDVALNPTVTSQIMPEKMYNAMYNKNLVRALAGTDTLVQTLRGYGAKTSEELKKEEIEAQKSKNQPSQEVAKIGGSDVAQAWSSFAAKYYATMAVSGVRLER